MNTHNRFDGYANDYTIGRPQNYDELIDHILEKSNLSGDFTIDFTIADKVIDMFAIK